MTARYESPITLGNPRSNAVVSIPLVQNIHQVKTLSTKPDTHRIHGKVAPLVNNREWRVERTSHPAHRYDRRFHGSRCSERTGSIRDQELQPFDLRCCQNCFDWFHLLPPSSWIAMHLETNKLLRKSFHRNECGAAVVFPIRN